MTELVSTSTEYPLESYDETMLLSASRSCAGHLSTCGLSDEWNGFKIKNKMPNDLSKSEQEKFYLMLEKNMKLWYEKNWGWKEMEKKKELFHPDSRFLCVYKSSPSTGDLEPTEELVAFVMFRFEWDDEDEPEHPVLFCYEIQIAEEYRGKSIGSHVSLRTSFLQALITNVYLIPRIIITSKLLLAKIITQLLFLTYQLMDLLVKIAKHWRMWKVLLTCFKNNEPAMDFYHKIGFGIDANSPSSFGFHTENYEILSNKPMMAIKK